jgi:hypothetical protein
VTVSGCGGEAIGRHGLSGRSGLSFYWFHYVY